MNFTIFNLENGSKNPCKLAELSQSLAPNCEILRKVGDSYEAIGFVSHKLLVFFSVEWADYALQNYAKNEIPEAKACISLVRKWIEDSSSVSNDQLRSAANAISAAANANAAYAAACAANTAANANANAAFFAANAAANADAAGWPKKQEFERQGNFILKHYENL